MLSVRSSKKSDASRLKSGALVSLTGATRGIRRTPPIIDVNLNSYSRTDPFQAFNVLLKLLSSLSSRVGGCQYRLTPQEHRLSLHLLNIIEPFVGSTPSKRTIITHQPTEILDAIVFHVSSRTDLLNLAMTCSRMHGVVIPRHFDYRVVKCKVSSVSVWNHLSVHRSLAMNVRRLEVLDERASREMVPGGISSTETDLEDTDDELAMHIKQEQYLLDALSKMAHLESFIWSCNHSPISIDTFWPILLKIHALKEMEINDNMVFAPMARQLKVVTLQSTRHAYGSTKHPDFTRVKGMLNSCPNLVSLNISYIHPRSSSSQTLLSADDLFLFGRWPSLTSLTLANLRFSSSSVNLSAASTFLFAHPNIEVLHLDISSTLNSSTFHKQIVFLSNSLPRLRELRAHRDVVSTILACPNETGPRPLEMIKGVKLSSSEMKNPLFFVNLRRFGSHVRRVELESWNEMDDIRKLIDSVPKLTWLDLGIKGYGHGRSGGGGGSYVPTVNVNEWAALLSSAPELTTFHGIKFFYEISLQAQASLASSYESLSNGSSSSPASSSSSSSIGSSTDRSRIRKNDETASLLAWKCPKLRRVDHWDSDNGGGSGGKVIVIMNNSKDVVKDLKNGEGKEGRDREKDKMGPRWEIRRVKQ
ncbi:hypothetical protein F5876DRAFT_89383 [Lentinula aff. lateritia]|uniref:Uncharacterized protein n=1 Tax=Lentinula aff. lateritia TaxID=2804960 RepID=A0ACC1TXR7_9AGAR|nr:hypothetical protein F5876DRAFT_89383 [Lentinula aff. lateritia]